LLTGKALNSWQPDSKKTGEEMPEIAQLFQDLGIKMSQNNYAEAVRYTADPRPSQVE
jgi:hypothetical protein